MEYHCNKDKQIALKIFEVALRSFGDNLEFVQHYLNFLLAVNEDTSMS
jgi:cleavage stimulation factor subunit 3